MKPFLLSPNCWTAPHTDVHTLAPAALQELKTASSALADELLRTRQESEREICTLRDDMAELAGRFKAEQVGGGFLWAI